MNVQSANKYQVPWVVVRNYSGRQNEGPVSRMRAARSLEHVVFMLHDAAVSGGEISLPPRDFMHLCGA